MKSFHAIAIFMICSVCLLVVLRSMLIINKPEEYVYKLKELSRDEYYREEIELVYTMVYEGPREMDFYVYAPVDKTQIFHIRDGVEPYLNVQVFPNEVRYQLYVP